MSLLIQGVSINKGDLSKGSKMFLLIQGVSINQGDLSEGSEKMSFYVAEFIGYFINSKSRFKHISKLYFIIKKNKLRNFLKK